MKTRLATILMLAVICAGVYMAASTERGIILAPAYAQDEFSARAVTINGQQVGEVFTEEGVVFRIRTSAGGLTPYQRAQIVARRLNNLMGDSFQAEDVTIGRVNGQDVVMAEDQIVITADSRHARLNNTTTLSLASLWAQRLENAVSNQPLTATPVGQKVVPIISVGRGTRVGGALVAGASDRLDDVVAVAQIEGQFGTAVRVRALIPVSTENVVQDISRVPETSVTGLVDIPL